MMGKTLARRLEKLFHFDMLVFGSRDRQFARIRARYVTWSDVKQRLQDMKGSSYESL